MEDEMALMTGGKAVVEILRAEGVRCVFGLPGGHTIYIYDALYNTPEIRHILVRHEQAAANMAAAYAQLTGEPGICCATAGPGATNLVTGITEAYMGSLPVIALTGRGVTRNALRGESQEIPQEKIFAPITKWAVRVDRPDTIVEIMRQAFNIARSGKPGPVLVDFPKDMLAQSVEFDGYVPVGKPLTPRGDREQVKKAVMALLKAARPIVIAGGGTVASGAFAELKEFAETFGVPVLTTLSGRSSFPDDHPLAAGGLGFHRNAVSKKLFMEADYVLNLGCRFHEMETNWTPPYLPSPDAVHVQVDIDPVEIGRSLTAQIGIAGDIRMVLQDLVEAGRKEKGTDRKSTFRSLPRIKELAKMKKNLEAAVAAAAGQNETPINSLQVVTEIRKVFPKDATVAIDVGCVAQALAGAYPYLKVYEPRSCIPCTSFYAMGFAASALPTAKVVYPDRFAVAVCGDGSFQMVLDILPVAAEHHLPVTWCILDNQCLGSIRNIQDGPLGGRTIATYFDLQPDFAKIAEACECYGEKVTDPREIHAALQRAMDANKAGTPAVLDFIISRKEPQAAIDFFSGRF
jgi:acetolactate synthase I/II/III large subunit